MTQYDIDNLKIYETAVRGLIESPEDLPQKHRAVLALARAGSLDFALSEYERLGLSKVRNHEDIMALGGRLYKDLYLSDKGAAADNYARQSAEKYEAAFKDTGGFYSGINSATMSLLGGGAEDIVLMRAERVLEILPKAGTAEAKDIYFVEATRAEAYVLLGQPDKAAAALRRARDYDPLNYPALASTLKQLHMIAKNQGETWPWLSEFTPPRAVQFAGHIFGLEGEAVDVPSLSGAQEKMLATQISETLQAHDIGFGLGALAAGSDIMIAEALLEEGSELHVILPVDVDSFMASSVTPFGKSWETRFKTCLDKAASVKCFEDFAGWPDNILQHRASLMAMGGAIRQADTLAVPAGQLLIWDGKQGAQGTAFDADIWSRSARPQYVLQYPGLRNARPHPAPKSVYKLEVTLSRSGSKAPVHFKDLRQAIDAALEARVGKNADIRQGVRLDIVSADSKPAKTDLCAALPGAVNVNELAANYLAVYHYDDFAADYMGQDDSGDRVFSVRKRGN